MAAMAFIGQKMEEADTSILLQDKIDHPRNLIKNKIIPLFLKADFSIVLFYFWLIHFYDIQYDISMLYVHLI